MKTSIRVRSFAALLVTICLLLTPISALAKKKGEKNYKQGMQYEAAQQWDRAAQEFSLAVAADPSNMEYQLHYRRALFNASQMFMIQGRSLAEQHDYIGAYNAFRQAYGYDPVNQLALSEMDRMMRLQNEKEGGDGTTNNGRGANGSDARVSPASLRTSDAATPSRSNNAQQEPSQLAPPRVEQLRVINYSGDLKSFIRSLAEQLNINVIFDSQSFRQPRNVEINLRDVTTAQALDYIFLQEGLFFQKLSRRTILVADQTRRPQYQQLVIRTFYLSNVDPKKVKTLIQQAIPPQQGRPQTIVIEDESTNSLTIRDTAENVRLIGDLISSIDKDRAEVVMDVNIYEVSRTDLLQFGNQLGTDAQLTNLGGLQRGLSAFLGDRGIANVGVPTAAGAALLIPPSVISALQRKDRTRLLASTQVHAFNGEESSARIGQRVPVQTAQTFPFGTTNNVTPGTGTGGVNTGVGFGGGFPVFNYEPTGLTLKFTPQVFPNLDVQVKMSIESKDVLNPGSLTPTFTERTITGTARIQNNRTMMLASVAQDKQSNGRAGIPLLGLIPIFGRLFSTPRRDNFQTDVVIAVTPRVLRAPAVTPRDEELRPSGTLQTPTTGSLEALLQDADREEQQLATAAARRARTNSIPTNVVVQLPDAEQPAYVPAPRALADTTASSNTTTAPNNATAAMTSAVGSSSSAPAPVQIPPAGAANQTTAAVATSLSNTTATAGNNSAPATVQSLALPGNADIAERLKAMLTQSSSAAPTMIGGNAQAATSALSAMDAPPPLPEKSAAAPANTAQPAASAKVEATVKTVATGLAELRLMSERQEMRVGEKQRLAVLLTTNAPLGTALLALNFDPHTISVRGITKGYVDAGGVSPTVTQSVDPNGLMLVSVSPSPNAAAAAGARVLFYLDIEAIAPGESKIVFDQNNMYLNAADGRALQLKLLPGRFTVKQ